MSNQDGALRRCRAFAEEIERHLTGELLPFWMDRCPDTVNGGFITHFDEHGADTGEDEKSLISQTRTIYSMSRAHEAGFGAGRCAEIASAGVCFLIDRFWDPEHGGFFWMTDRAGRVTSKRKIMYGQSFAVYALSTCARVTGDERARDYALRTYETIHAEAADAFYGGYYEMFEDDWTLSPAGAGGGDRKTLDVHMHLMEAFTSLYRLTGSDSHRRKLIEIIEIIDARVLHPEFRTGIPQFYRDWTVAPQIKFDVVWGWDRFSENGVKEHPDDNTSAGHNAEFAWLLLLALDTLEADAPGRSDIDAEHYLDLAARVLDHVVENGVDREFGGVYVEGPHSGGVYDREKEFWQQAEAMIGLLEGYRRFEREAYLDAYELVHRFVFDHGINHGVGEWWPLMRRDGEPIWRHMSHAWKVNYHTIRCAVECLERLRDICRA